MQNKEKIKYVFLGLILLVIFFLPKEASAGFWSKFAEASIGTVFASLGLIFVGLMAGILKIAGDIFDLAIGMTLLNPGINNIDAIKIGWRIIRDISNLFLIFALVFIAIATILQIESYGAKKLILPLILVALLINFSLAVTKFIIDISNILALQFYYAVDVQTSGPEGTANAPNSEYKSLSSVFMAGTSLQGVYEYDFAKEGASRDPNTGAEIKTPEITNWNIGKAQWLGGILFAIAAFVLFAGAILFIIRQVSLLILMVLSPLAFVFGIFPGTKKHGQEWWNALFSQAFFAPAFLFMFYLVAKIAQESKFLDLIGVGTRYGSRAASLGEYLAGEAAARAATGATPEGGYLINFLIMAALMIGALWVAKKMGAVGADMTWKWGGKISKSMSGYAGRLATRHTVGRLGEAVAESKTMKKIAARSPAVGGWFARQAKKVSKTGGFEKVREEQVALGISLSPEQRARFIASSPKAVREGMWGKMSDREIAEMQDRAPAETKKFINELISRLPEAKKEKVYEALGKRDLKRDNKDNEITGELGLINMFFERELATQLEILNEMKKERLPSFTQGMTPEQQDKLINNILPKARRGLDTQIFKANPTLAALSGTDEERIAAMAEKIQTKGINIADIDPSMAEVDRIDKPENKLFMKALVRGLQSGDITKLQERGGPLFKIYMEYLKELGNSDKRADVVKALEDNKNISAANYFRSSLIAPESFGLAKEPPAATPPQQQAGFIPQGYQAGGGQAAAPPPSGQQPPTTTPTTPPAGGPGSPGGSP